MNTETNATPRFVTIRELAKSGILPEFVLRRMCAENRLPGFYSGRKFLVNETIFMKWIADPESPLSQGTGKKVKTS